MNIIGAILFAGIGIVWFFMASGIRRKSTDYTSYPVTVGTVLHTENFVAERWTASFCIDGKDVLGMDDRFAASTWKPEKYHLPKYGDPIPDSGHSSHFVWDSDFLTIAAEERKVSS
ncbi:MAG: hypothetical protein LUD73_01685 [Lachnospiraceae bacterium]|nr:hypothetical protein [Lachnospiraceae bacterium]MCD8248931.1 hypothetical protein [Lachnospiraceae bacterium]